MKTNKITIMGISLISSAIILAGCKNSLPTSEGSESDETFTQNVSVTTVFSEKSYRYSECIFDNVDVKADIVYAEKKDYLGNNIQLKLDVYQPAEDALDKRPVIIWVHGGGMYVGSKNESWDPVTFLANDLAKKGLHQFWIQRQTHLYRECLLRQIRASLSEDRCDHSPRNCTRGRI